MTKYKSKHEIILLQSRELVNIKLVKDQKIS